MSQSVRYVYVFVRVDIPLADQICQVAHVCLEAGREYNVTDSCNLVLLQVEGQEQLQQAHLRALAHGVATRSFYEPDDALGYTALATREVTREERKLFSQYKLWRPHEATQQQSQPAIFPGAPLALETACCLKSSREKAAPTANCLWKTSAGSICVMLRNWAMKLK